MTHGASRRGQSTIEYLAVAMTLIAVVWAVAPRVRAVADRIIKEQVKTQLLTPSATADGILPR